MWVRDGFCGGSDRTDNVAARSRAKRCYNAAPATQRFPASTAGNPTAQKKQNMDTYMHRADPRVSCRRVLFTPKLGQCDGVAAVCRA